MKHALLALIIATVVSPLFAADGPYMPADAERGRWTMSDMSSWRICFASYKQDHGKYPEAKSAAEARAAFEPIYIAHLPMSDAWGRPYDVASDATSFTVASAGADGKFDKTSWSSGGALISFDDDAVVTQEGRWLFRHWAMK
jgi:Bacterial type II secretion system protein G.